MPATCHPTCTPRPVYLGLDGFVAVKSTAVPTHLYLPRLNLAVCLLAAVLGGPGRRIGAAVAVLLALSGVMAALWQHFKAASSVSCNLTLADKILSGLQLDRLLPDVFEPRASCADAAVNLLGVPYDFWSLALFVLVVLAAARLMGRR